MIRLYNQDEFLVKLVALGTQSTGTNKDIFIAPFDGYIVGIVGLLGAAGTTGTQISDVLIEGTTIFSGATRINFASGSRTATYGTLSTVPPLFSYGDVLRLDVTQIHTTAASNLQVLLAIRRRTGGQRPAAVSFGRLPRIN